MNILIRADSSSTIGTGHIMRDLVLAGQYENANIIFATQNLSGNINHKIKEENYALEILKSNEVEELIMVINKHMIDMVIIDHYEIDHTFEKGLKDSTDVTVFVLDDTYEKHYCDILLNHNIYADSSKYKSLVPDQCELRCGSQYTLLREEFVSEKSKKASKYTSQKFTMFIAMGGTDHSNLNIKILEVLKDFQNIHAHVVTTTANQYLTQLKEYTNNRDDVTLHVNTKQIAKLMNESDFAIVTPSVTLNEIVYLEKPFIAIKTAENQDEMYKYLLKNGYKTFEKFDSDGLRESVEKFLDETKVKLVNFTDLSLDDKQMVLTWRNHPNVRKWMFNKDQITIEDHLKYVESLHTREDRVYFLVKKNSCAIGVIDFTNINRVKKSAELGIYANPTLKGVGGLLMETIIDYAFNTLFLTTLISEVFEENYAAIKLYKRYSFKDIMVKKDNNTNVIHMELKNENR